METFNCVCPKCGKKFVSDNGSDYDGEAFCPECIIKNKEIAAKVDAQIAKNRAKGKKVSTGAFSVDKYSKIRDCKNKNVMHFMNI